MHSTVYFLPGDTAEPCGKFYWDQCITLDHERGSDLRIEIRLNALREICHCLSFNRPSFERRQKRALDVLDAVRWLGKPGSDSIQLLIV